MTDAQSIAKALDILNSVDWDKVDTQTWNEVVQTLDFDGGTSLPTAVHNLVDSMHTDSELQGVPDHGAVMVTVNGSLASDANMQRLKDALSKTTAEVLKEPDYWVTSSQDDVL